MMCTWGVERTLSVAGSFLSPWIPGCQTWWQVCLPAELAHQPGFTFSFVTKLHEATLIAFVFLGTKEANNQ